jgi:hypothetical protein
LWTGFRGLTGCRLTDRPTGGPPTDRSQAHRAELLSSSNSLTGSMVNTPLLP